MIRNDRRWRGLSSLLTSTEKSVEKYDEGDMFDDSKLSELLERRIPADLRAAYDKNKSVICIIILQTHHERMHFPPWLIHCVTVERIVCGVAVSVL